MASDRVGVAVLDHQRRHSSIASQMINSPHTAGSSKPWTLAVRAVIHDDQGRMLLLRRSQVCRNFVGCWEWPGGKLDTGEDFESAVKRETRGETSLEVEITGIAGVTHSEAPATHFVMLCLETRVVGGGLRLSEEHDQYAWVAPVDFQKLPFAGQVEEFMLEYSNRRGVQI